jgi:hypothetical protein
MQQALIRFFVGVRIPAGQALAKFFLIPEISGASAPLGEQKQSHRNSL